MTLTEFVAAVRAGQITTTDGGREGDKYVTRAAPLAEANPVEITAVAFQYGVFEETIRWKDALAQVRDALAGGEKGDDAA